MKVAVVGVNNIGALHAQAYLQNPQAELVAVVDLIAERADEAARRYGVKAYYSVDDLLESEDVDAVSVATSGVENGSHHFEPAMKAMEAGVNVLCEKPLCNEIEKARQMVAAAREKGVYLGTNLNHRMVPAAYRAKALIDEGRLGSLLFINMALWVGNPNETSPWFHLRALHPHSIDVMRYFCGDVTRVQSFLRRAPGRKTWSTASINMEFANGVVGHLSGSYDMVTRHPIERCEVGGSSGRFVIDNVYEDLVYFPHDSGERMWLHNSTMQGVKGFQETFRNRIDRFVEDIEAGVPPESIEASGADGLAAQEVIEAAIASWERQEIVALEEAQQ